MMISPIVARHAAPLTSSRPDLSHILRAVRLHLRMDVGFISEFVQGRRVFRQVETAEGKRCIEVGGSDPLEESYCHWIAMGKLARLIRDPREHPLTAKFAVTEALPVGAHLSVPIRLRSGRIYGTFCCFSFVPDHTLSERDMATMEAFAQVAGDIIQSSIDEEERRSAKLAKITQVLRTRDVQMVYQPAVGIDAPGIRFFEALARFRGKPYQSPDRWFAGAGEVGLGQELELVAVEAALQDLPSLPTRAALSINVSAETASSEALPALLQRSSPERLIVEITEHDTVSSYGRLLAALKPLRSRGLRIAVDDAGAGHSSFRHILKLKPDIIKLDMSLSQGIDRDPGQRALATALIAFSREVGAELVAEGVETEEELDTLRRLGVRVAQGYLFGRPQPIHGAEGLLSDESAAMAIT